MNYMMWLCKIFKIILIRFIMVAEDAELLEPSDRFHESGRCYWRRFFILFKDLPQRVERERTPAQRMDAVFEEVPYLCERKIRVSDRLLRLLFFEPAFRGGFRHTIKDIPNGCNPATPCVKEDRGRRGW